MSGSIENHILPAYILIPERSGWKRRLYPDHDWLPSDSCGHIPVETASFWEMVDREQRRNEFARQKQEVFRRLDACMELREMTQDNDNDRNDTLRECYDRTVGPRPIEYLVPDGDPWTLPCRTIAKLETVVETVSDTMVTGDGVASGLEKMETASTKETEGEVGLSCAAVDSRLLSTTVLICFLLFAFLCLNFVEQSLLLDLTRGFNALCFPGL